MWFFNRKKTFSNPFEDVQHLIDAREETVQFLVQLDIKNAQDEKMEGRYTLFRATMSDIERSAFDECVRQYGETAVKEYITGCNSSLAKDICKLISNISEDGGDDGQSYTHVEALQVMEQQYRQYDGNLNAA